MSVRMWSPTSIVQVVQVGQAGPESASVFTRGKKRTSCAMWKTNRYVRRRCSWCFSSEQRHRNNESGIIKWHDVEGGGGGGLRMPLQWPLTPLSMQGITFRRVGVPTASDIIKSSSKDAVRWAVSMALFIHLLYLMFVIVVHNVWQYRMNQSL